MVRFTALVFASVLVCMGTVGAGTTVRPPRQAIGQQHGWMDAHANPKHAWLYVSGYSNNTVAIYDLERNGFPKIGTITDGVSGPAGVSVDASGTLYVANQTGSVTIYAPGTTSPSLTITQGLGSPIDAITDAAGNVYVCNRGNAPSITVYAPGQAAPSQVITSSLIQIPSQAAFDSAGDLYFSDNNTGVSEIPSGTSAPVSLGLQGLQRTDGLALDPLNGNLFVGTFGNRANAVFVYPLGGTSSIGELKPSDGADLQAVGTVRHTEYVFVPDSSNDEIRVFKHNRFKHPAFTLNVSAAHYPVGVAVKAASIP